MDATHNAVNDALTELLIERHHAVLTAGGRALVRADHLMASDRDAERVPEPVARWLETPRPAGPGVARLPVRADAGVDLLELLDDVSQRYRRVSLSPNHIVRGAPSTWGGPADEPVVLDTPLAEPQARPQTDPDARPVTVAILDTGVVLHPWFMRQSWFAEVDAGDHEILDANPYDYRLDAQAGHGTFIAGVVLQHAPAARLRIRRLLASDGVCDEVDLVNALHDVREHSASRGEKIDIINLSLGYSTYDDRPSPVVADAITSFGRGTVVVACAGNAGDDRPFWPAALKSAVAVGALDSDGSDRAPFSNFGWWVDACAIGERVRSSFVDFDGPLPPTGDFDRDRFRGYATWSGTSFAAPVVAGEIARLASEKRISAAEAADQLLDPATQPSIPDLGVAVGVPSREGA
jgi:subtilisin family serine protease